MDHCMIAAPDEGISSVLIVDDHPLYSDALASALEGVFGHSHVEKVGSLGGAMTIIDEGFKPDLVMFDLKLPDVTGISGFLSLRERTPDVPILVISSLTSHELVAALMKEGAAGFLPKDTSAQVLQSVLTDVAAGKKYVPLDYRQAGKLQPQSSAPHKVHPKLATLTPQQQKVMKLICEGKPNKLIAYELDLAEATVKAHITALLRRLGVSNRTQAALLVDAQSNEDAGNSSEPEARTFLNS